MAYGISATDEMKTSMKTTNTKWHASVSLTKLSLVQAT